MKSVFRFSDKLSFLSDESKELASLLLYVPVVVRKKLKDDLGISVELDCEPIRISHDGRKVGLASFLTPTGQVTVSVGPKVEALRLKSLFRALGEDQLGGRQVRFDVSASATRAYQTEGDFTPAFLLHLLQEIAVLSSQLFTGSIHKKTIAVRGGTKGRPLFRESITNQVLGRSQNFLCQVVDEDSLVQYKLVILATARDIMATLREWENLLDAADEDVFSKWRVLVSKFRLWDTSQFSVPLLFKLCRPPFPFGLRLILYKCLQYWMWKGRYELAAHGTGSAGFWGMFVNLDNLFERYVGQVWQSSLPNFEWLQPNYHYVIDGLPGNSVQANQREIRPDHIFIEHEKKRAFIVDAKYRTDVGSRDQIFQIVSYLNYAYPNFDDSFSRVGVLVYPAETWAVGRLTQFGRKVFLIQMPVEAEPVQNRIQQFIDFAEVN